MKATKFMQVAAVVLAAGLSLGGCGSAAAGSESGGRQEITFWGPWAGDQIAMLDQMTAKYNKSQDKYTVKYSAQSSAMEQKLLTSIAAGDTPDVVLWDSFQTGTYAPKGALLPIDDLVKKDNIDTSRYYPAALGQLQSGGKLYGLPLVSDVRALGYNTDMFKKAGISEPPKTWDELLADAKKLAVHKNGKLETAGILFSPTDFATYLWQAGGEMYKDGGRKTAYNSPEGMEVLNFWQKMLDAGVYEVGFENTKTDQFAAGNAAMRLDAPWDWANLKASGVKYAFAEPPAGPNGDKGSMTGGFGLAIPKGAKHAEGAWDFIKWFAANEDNELAFCKLAQWLPADKAVAQDDYFKTDEWTPFVKSLEFAKARPQTPGWQEAAQKALDPYFQRFMNGELTAKQALDQSSQQMDSLLAKSFSE